MGTPLHILHLEDDPSDAALLQRTLGRAGFDVHATVCRSRAELETALGAPELQLVVSDGGVFDVTGRAALELVRTRRPELPFLFLFGTVDADDALAHLAAGALDCVSKDQMWRVVMHARGIVASVEQPAERERDDRDTVLLDLLAQMSSITDLQSLIRIVREGARRLVAADTATLILRDGDDVLYTDERSTGPIAAGFRTPLQGSISGTAILGGKPVLVGDLSKSAQASKQLAGKMEHLGVAAFPVGRPVPFGAMVVAWVHRYEPSAREQGVLVALADATAIVLSAILARQSLEKRMRERSVALEAANRELEAFSYSVSHDLRAPLRHISGYLEALVEDAGDALPAHVGGHVAQMRSAIKRMDGLINDLLSLARVARAEMRGKRVDLSELAARVGERLRAAAPDREIELRIEPGVAVYGDEGLLQIAIENLLGNAWKYTSRKPKALVEVGRAPAADASSGDTVVFVRDDGAGFDPALAGRLFRPFQRLHAPDEFPGTGIGLATVQRIVAKHGGRIWAEGRPDEGATFYLALPAG